MVTVGSIFGGNGIFIWYFVLSTLDFYFLFIYPTLIPSSISVDATFSSKATTNFAICLTLIKYLFSSFLSFDCIIFVHLAT
jgi:hypothetical protein